MEDIQIVDDITSELTLGVESFNKSYKIYTPDSSIVPGLGLSRLRLSLLLEEVGEFFEALLSSSKRSDFILSLVQEIHSKINALEDEDLDYNSIEAADALGDIMFISTGTAAAFGIPIDPVVREIIASNLSKLDLDGSVIRRADGKILKGPNYFPPDIESILKK